MSQKNDGTPLGAATGCATAVDAALAWFSPSDFKTADIADGLRLTGPHRFHAQKISMRAGDVLADEVRRLRGVVSAIATYGRPENDPDQFAPIDRREIYDITHAVTRESHNEVAERRAQGKETK